MINSHTLTHVCYCLFLAVISVAQALSLIVPAFHPGISFYFLLSVCYAEYVTGLALQACKPDAHRPKVPAKQKNIISHNGFLCLQNQSFVTLSLF